MNDIGNAAQWVSAIVATASLIVATIGLVIALRARRSKETDDRFRGVSEQIATVDRQAKAAAAAADRLDIRVTRVEDEMRHLPDKDATHRIELALTELRGDMKAFSPVVEMVHRIHESMLEKAH